jgi:AcrR family transcriptional regulator
MEYTTIRNIADQIGYSIGTLYLYYRDKNEILHDLHTQGFIKLREAMSVLTHVADPMERLKALGRVYIGFALVHTEMYDLMFNLKESMHDQIHVGKEECPHWKEGQATFQILKVTVQECMDAGYFGGQSLEPTSFAIWSCVHGLASLHTKERTKGVKFQNPETILDEAYCDFIKMLVRK